MTFFPLAQILGIPGDRLQSMSLVVDNHKRPEQSLSFQKDRTCQQERECGSEPPLLALITSSGQVSSRKTPSARTNMKQQNRWDPTTSSSPRSLRGSPKLAVSSRKSNLRRVSSQDRWLPTTHVDSTRIMVKVKRVTSLRSSISSQLSTFDDNSSMANARWSDVPDTLHLLKGPAKTECDEETENLSRTRKKAFRRVRSFDGYPDAWLSDANVQQSLNSALVAHFSSRSTEPTDKVSNNEAAPTVAQSPFEEHFFGKAEKSSSAPVRRPVRQLSKKALRIPVRQLSKQKLLVPVRQLSKKSLSADDGNNKPLSGTGLRVPIRQESLRELEKANKAASRAA